MPAALSVLSLTATTPVRQPDESVDAHLVHWLADQALPLWADVGVDRQGGGFFEKIDREGRPVEEPRRTRVVARQVYVFATAARRRWLADADALVDHGLDFLLTRMRLPDGSFAASVRPDGAIVDPTFDLYEHAFVLFALASASRGRPDREPSLRREAEALLRIMRSRWAHPLGGFEESAPRTLPLRSNPHMHLLEAALAWRDLSQGVERDAWDTLADELVTLCLTRFIDPQTGALYEYFAGDWSRIAGPQGRHAEPGHQFEWAWLLMQWSRGAMDAALDATVRRLLQIGETHGVDVFRGVAVDAIEDGFRISAGSAKLWPQTERIKAWHAASHATGHPVQASNALRNRERAMQGLSRYLLGRPAGLWEEQMRADGSFVTQDCRASSLYHIVCAIDTLSDRPDHPPQPRPHASTEAVTIPG